MRTVSEDLDSGSESDPAGISAEAKEKPSGGMFSKLGESTLPSKDAVDSAVSSEDALQNITRIRELSEEDRKVTPSDKLEFLNALFGGKRMRLQFSFFGGKLTCTIRSRTQRESDAIFRTIRRDLVDPEKSSYDIISRTAALYYTACQVDMINGTSYPEFEEPMYFENSNGIETPPAWMKTVDLFRNMSHAVIDSLGIAVTIFEYKYLVMLNESRNENFWKTDSSTGL